MLMGVFQTRQRTLARVGSFSVCGVCVSANNYVQALESVGLLSDLLCPGSEPKAPLGDIEIHLGRKRSTVGAARAMGAGRGTVLNTIHSTG